MKKDDGAVCGILHNVVVHGVRIVVFPVHRIHRPGDDGVRDIGPDGGIVLAAGDADQIIVAAAHGAGQIGTHLIDLTLHLAAGDLGEGGMSPAVVCQLMALRHHAGQQGVVVLDAVASVCTAHEECGGDPS